MSRNIFVMIIMAGVLIMGTTVCSGKSKGGETADKPYDFRHDVVGYIQEQRIRFVDVETKAVQTLTEETDTVLALCYVPDAEALFYLAANNGTVRLRKARFTDSNATLTELLDTQLMPEDCPLGLKHFNGKLLFPANPFDESGSFVHAHIYTIADNKLFSTEDYEEAKRLLGNFLPEEKKDPRFESKSGQLIFTDNGRSVILSDRLDIRPEPGFFHTENGRLDKDVFYDRIECSPDGTKVCFQACNSMGNSYYGPICIANADGTHQQKLLDYRTDTQWIGNRLLCIGFTNTDDDETMVVGITHPDDNRLIELASDIEAYAVIFIPAKRKHPD